MSTPPVDPWSGDYSVPHGFGFPAYPQGGDPYRDPLVPPPNSGFDGWMARVREVIARSWRSIGLILLVTTALPNIVGQLVAFAVGFVAFSPGQQLNVPRAGLTAGAIVAGVGFAIVVSALTALGWAACIWAITQEATGQPVTLGAAIAGGARRALAMWGWYLLSGLLVVLGLIACVIPGLYFAVAVSLFSFVVMYERGTNPISRSFSLVNGSFGAALGRVLLLAVAAIGLNLLTSCVTGVLSTGIGLAGRQAVTGVISALVEVVIDLVLLAGLLVTYTQLRSRTEPVGTGQLWAAVNAPTSL
jgi:hypothetical protein